MMKKLLKFSLSIVFGLTLMLGYSQAQSCDQSDTFNYNIGDFILFQDGLNIGGDGYYTIKSAPTWSSTKSLPIGGFDYVGPNPATFAAPYNGVILRAQNGMVLSEAGSFTITYYVNGCASDANGNCLTSPSTHTECYTYNVASPTKYTCSNYSCVQDNNGEYTSSNCNNSCGTPPVAKYLCSNYQCVRDDANGNYTSSNCDGSCTPPPTPKYLCSNYQCVRDDANGNYTSSNCDGSCTPPPTPKYLCSNYQCVRDDANGNYTSSNCDGSCGTAPYCGDGIKNNGEACDKNDSSHNGWGNGGCDNNCNPINNPTSTPKYLCSNYQCVRDDANGNYTSSNCDGSCTPPPTPKYLCSNYQCVRDDANGNYTSSNCDGSCTPPQQNSYQCRITNGNGAWHTIAYVANAGQFNSNHNYSNYDEVNYHTTPPAQNCQYTPPTTKYKCSNYTCIAASDGTFTTSNCNNSCGTAPYCGDGIKNNGEACDKNDSSKNGWGKDGCDNECKPINNPRYACSNYKCIRDDANGEYTSNNCNNSCGFKPLDVAVVKTTSSVKIKSGDTVTYYIEFSGKDSNGNSVLMSDIVDLSISDKIPEGMQLISTDVGYNQLDKDEKRVRGDSGYIREILENGNITRRTTPTRGPYDNGEWKLRQNLPGDIIQWYTGKRNQSKKSWVIEVKMKYLGTLTPGTCIPNTVWISLENPGDIKSNNTSTATVCVEGGVTDVQIVKTVDKPVFPNNTGEIITWTLAYKNNGPATAENVEIIDTLPNGLTYFGEFAPTNEIRSIELLAGNKIKYILRNPLLVNGSGTIIVKSKYLGGKPDNQDLLNKVEITTTTPETNTGNNKDDEPTKPVSDKADVQIVKTVDKPTIPNQSGQVVVWTMTYRNNGPATAKDVKITDTMPNGIAYISSIPLPASASGQELIWNMGDLQAGSGGVIVLTTIYNGSVANGTELINKVVITTTTPETNTGNNTGQDITKPYAKSSLGDKVWLDKDGDGIQDPNEPGVNDVKVELYMCTGGAAIATTYTNNSGLYLFTGLDAGSYKVKFTLPNGYSWTVKGAGNNTGLDSNVNNDGTTDCIILGNNEHNPTIDAGVKLPWNPVSCDAITLNPVTVVNSGVITYNCSGTNVTTGYVIITKSGSTTPTTINNLSGTFTLNEVGSYTVQCVVDSGVTYGIKKFEFTNAISCAYKQKADGRYCAVQANLTPHMSSNINFNDLLLLPNPIPYCTPSEISTLACVDSPANTQILTKDENTCKATVTVTSSGGTATVGDFVRIDEDKDGIQDANETGLANVKVELYMCNGNSLLATTYTNGSGYYLFTGLNAGNYKVKFYAPSGYSITTKNIAGSTADNNSDMGSDGFSDCFDLANGQDRRDIDAGLHTTPSGPGCTVNCDGGPTNYCGNGRIDIDNGITEQCDDGVYNGYANSNCTRDCKIKSVIGTGVGQVPKCDYVDPPSINKGEVLPFRWNMEEISKNNSGYSTDIYTTNGCNVNTVGKANRNTAMCEFVIFRANSNGNQQEVARINSVNCFNTNSNTLIRSAITKQFLNMPNKNPSFDGYSWYNSSTFPSYGEYIIRLNKISYESCVANTSTSNNVTTTTYARQSNTFNKAVCDYNFAVTKPYAINRGSSISSIGNYTFNDFYAFGKSTPIGNDINIKAISVGYSTAIKSEIDKFVTKYQNSNKDSNGKVRNKDIYIINGDFTYTDSNRTVGTLIVNGNVTVKGNVSSNIAIIANNIKFETTNCDATQVVNGLYIARNGFVAGTNIQNVSSSNANRCNDGRLNIKGKLIGNNVESIISNRRSYLNDWFNYTNNNKYQPVINGAALKIEENANIWNISGINELKSTLSITK